MDQQEFDVPLYPTRAISYTPTMPTLDLTQAEVKYLAKMNAENVAVMQFLEKKGESLDDLATARGLHERFLTLLPEGIPNILAAPRQGPPNSKSVMKRTSQRKLPPKKV